jgi:hypothetical protein
MATVCIPAAVFVGNPLHARPFRVVSGCGFRLVPAAIAMAIGKP